MVGMTWPEILDAIKGGCDAAILPLGATEQHGPHLGTGMDSVLAEKLCAAVGKGSRCPSCRRSTTVARSLTRIGGRAHSRSVRRR